MFVKDLPHAYRLTDYGGDSSAVEARLYDVLAIQSTGKNPWSAFWPTRAPSRPSTCSYCFQLLEGLLAGDALSEAVRLGSPLLPRCQLPGRR